MKKRSFVILILLIGILGVAVYVNYQQKQPLVYEDNLDAVVATIDGEDMTLGDLAFYIAYEERQVEQQAQIYNPDNTRDYWNLHVDGVFIQQDAKDTVMKTAIHDWVFYRLAKKKKLELTDEEEKILADTTSDFWMDLLDEQKDRLHVSDENINETIRQIAYAQKYQEYIADKTKSEYASYAWDGFYYEQMLEKEHKVKINDRVWDRITLGNITLHHGKVSYVNGQ